MQSALAAAAAAISSMAWLMTIWSPAGSSAITPNCAFRDVVLEGVQ